MQWIWSVVGSTPLHLTPIAFSHEHPTSSIHTVW